MGSGNMGHIEWTQTSLEGLVPGENLIRVRCWKFILKARAAASGRLLIDGADVFGMAPNSIQEVSFTIGGLRDENGVPVNIDKVLKLYVPSAAIGTRPNGFYVEIFYYPEPPERR